MPFLNFNYASPGLKLVITLMSILTIGLIVWFTGFLMSRLFFCIDVPEANDILYGLNNNLNVKLLRYYQIVLTIGFLIIPGFFLQWLFSTPEKSYFAINVKPVPRSVGLVLLLIIAAIPLINYLVGYNSSIEFPSFLADFEHKLKELEAEAQSATQLFLNVNNVSGYLINILMIATLPAIGEELIFRGIFQKIFINISRNKHMGIILAAILFSAVHGQFYGFIPRFVLGLLFGYLMIWSGTIWLPILAHFFNNLLAITFYYFYNIGVIENAPEEFGLLQGSFWVFASLLLSVIICFVIYRLELKRTILH